MVSAFPSASRLAAVCRILAARGYAGTSAAYLGDDGRLLLLLETPRGRLRPDPLDFLTEYGTPLQGGVPAGEHAVLLTRRAVETLAPLAVT